VALAEIKPENLQLFQSEHGGDHLYTDYREMLAKENLDIVSICTWPHLHAEMTIAAAEAGVKAIHCEKPMAPTFGEAKRMAEACQVHGTQLTFNHQRRFGTPFRKAKELLQAGAIGKLERLEASCPDMLDWGTHWFDMLFMFNDETPVDWVIGQVEVRGSIRIFGVPVDGQGVSLFRYRNGVSGLLVTGYQANRQAALRLMGSEGTIELGVSEKVHLRIWCQGQPTWEVIATDEGLHGDGCHERTIADLVDALKTGREPEQSARRALQTTELIFATYESSRRRGRVDLPLDISDSPFLTMYGQ
jgi:predicted dehydrogenase